VAHSEHVVLSIKELIYSNYSDPDYLKNDLKIHNKVCATVFNYFGLKGILYLMNLI